MSRIDPDRKKVREDKQLIVEGKKDKFVIAEFMELAGVVWSQGNEPIHIEETGGKSKIANVAKEILKSELLKKLGIVMDADSDSETAWQSIRNSCIRFFPEIPKAIPESGFWIGDCMTKRLGIWIMPGMKKPGMIEDFLVDCMKHDESTRELWDFANFSTMNSKNHGATYIESHLIKAKVHCWLAWQNEPGNQLHQVMEKRFNPQAGSGPDFVKWFRELFDPVMKQDVD
jgi:hypothetical protein